MTLTTIFLEAHYFGEDREDLLLSCEAVAATTNFLIIAGVQARHLYALTWRPDHVSYWNNGELLRLAVGQWVALDERTVRFTLR